MEQLNILMASPEAVPFVKTGGLADVAGALPQALASLGCNIKVIVPLYKAINRDEHNISRLKSYAGKLSLKVGENEYKLSVYSSGEDSAGVEFLFVENEKLFGRNGIYLDPETGKDFADNDERYIFFARAVLEIAKGLKFRPDIFHLHDWQAAMVAGYLKTLYSQDQFFKDSRTIFTIHNIGYQGLFEKSTFLKLGLPLNLFSYGSPFEYWDGVNFLKIGINMADLVTTVSETYAHEIQSGKEYGFGLEGVLADRKNSLFGVLNGVDYEIWSPEKDTLIPYNYSARNLSYKEKNKQALLKLAGLSQSKKKIPLFGAISRLADQKGFDLIEKIADQLLAMDLTFIVLGTGDEKYHALFSALEELYPHKIKTFLKFDNKIAHMIEAGADIFLMPSRYEPCGLNQMYSLKYGTVPIVRATGGLADTIIDYNQNPAEGNGFVFHEYEPDKLLDAIQRALTVCDDSHAWTEIQYRGMSADFSWHSSAQKYLEIYHHALKKQPALP